MVEILLQTKLFVPPIRPSLVPRPHLIAKLNQGLHGKLTLISAPAGFGKTTLVKEWMAAGERPSPDHPSDLQHLTKACYQRWHNQSVST